MTRSYSERTLGIGACCTRHFTIRLIIGISEAADSNISEFVRTTVDKLGEVNLKVFCLASNFN